jgi:peptidoglycan/LPS O-acetylase OafA/YrhL
VSQSSCSGRCHRSKATVGSLPDKAIIRLGVSFATRGAAILLLAAMLSLSPSLALADDGHSDNDSMFGVVYIGMFFVVAVVALLIILQLQRRARNPHTGLLRPVKRRRVRGPIKNGRVG